MPNWFNRGKYQIASAGTVLSSATINVSLHTETYTFDRTDNFVSDLSNEVSGGSYARQTLGSKTVTEEDTGNGRAYFDAADATFSAVPDQSGSKIDTAVVFDNAGGADSSRNLLFDMDFTGIFGNGSDITVQWNASGIAEIGAAS